MPTPSLLLIKYFYQCLVDYLSNLIMHFFSVPEPPILTLCMDDQGYMAN